MTTITRDDTEAGSAAEADRFAVALAAMAGQLGDLVEVPAWTLSPAQVKARLGEALAVKAGLDELAARLVAGCAEAGVPESDGATSDGGPTDISNGCLLYGYHHRLLHRGQWAVMMAADGICELIPPTRIDPQQQPIRHARYKPRPG